jgi:hypothetical protein
MAGSERLNKGEITESEAAEFKTRLERYEKRTAVLIRNQTANIS